MVDLVNNGDASTGTMAQPQEFQSAFYDRLWRECESLDAQSPAAFHRRRLLTRLVRRRTLDCERLLDVGCGRGELLAELRRRLPRLRLSGADLSRQALVLTRRQVPDADTFLLDLMDPDFACRCAERLESYDVVVCSEVLEHLQHEAVALGHLYSLLVPGGTLILSVPGGRKSRFDQLIGHQRHYSAPRLGQALAAAGFVDVCVRGWGFPFHSLYRSAVRVASGLALARLSGPVAEAGVAGSVSCAGGPGGRQPQIAASLARLYGLSGRVFRLLFFLNLPALGEQMFAVARRPTVYP